MYSWLVTVLLLASGVNSSGGAQVPITSYTCTQPNIAVFLDQGQCTVSGGLRTCAINEGALPALLSSNDDLGVYAWDSNVPPYPNPFVVLDIPQGWCVGSVEMTFRAPGSIPTLSLSVHSAERLSTNTDRTMFSIVSEVGTRLVVMNLTTLARGKYLRINMTSTGRLYLNEIEVFGTNDSICTHPSSAGGNPASPTTSVTPASPTTSVTPASPTTSVTPASPTTSVTPASPTTSVTPASPTTSVTPIRTSDYSTTSGPSSTPSQSSTIQSGASFTVFVLGVAPSPSPSPTPGGVPVAPDSYVLPAAISAAAVLLVVVLTAIFVVVICIITRRHKTQKSLDTQRLSSIHYQSTQSDVAFEDNKLHTGQSADVPIHDEKVAVDTNHNIEIKDAPHSYAVMGPSESNDNIVQDAAEEPVTEGAISRPTSQASIRSNEVSSKPTHGMVTRVHPSMLDRPYDRPNWENTTAGTDESGHYETSLHWQHAGGPYYNLSDCQLPGEGAARDDRHRVVKEAKVGTTHQPPPQAPPSVLPTAADSAYANTSVASDKRREPSTSSPTYANIDPPSISSTLAATRPSKQHSSHPKPLPSAESPRVSQEDHIDKTSASSTSFPLPRLTHRSDGTRDYTEVDADLWGGSGNVEGDTMAQPQSITSSTTAKGAVPTQGVTIDHVYAAVDYSKKKSRRGEES